MLDISLSLIKNVIFSYFWFKTCMKNKSICPRMSFPSLWRTRADILSGSQLIKKKLKIVKRSKLTQDPILEIKLCFLSYSKWIKSSKTWLVRKTVNSLLSGWYYFINCKMMSKYWLMYFLKIGFIHSFYITFSGNYSAKTISHFC